MPATARLSEYVALAKNVRGIFAYDPANDPPSGLKTWLARIHRYRNVGMPPAVEDQTELDLSAKTFERLPYPVTELQELVDHLSTQYPQWLVESLVLSSSYVAPLFVHRPALSAFEPAAVWQLRVAEMLPGDQIKRHMRIVGYGMLDFHRAFTEAAADAVVNESVDEERGRREAVCRKDGEKRFWRLFDDEGEMPSDGKWVGGYCDILGLLDSTAVELLQAAPQLHISLGVVGVFIVEQSDDGAE